MLQQECNGGSIFSVVRSVDAVVVTITSILPLSRLAGFCFTATCFCLFISEMAQKVLGGFSRS